MDLAANFNFEEKRREKGDIIYTAGHRGKDGEKEEVLELSIFLGTIVTFLVRRASYPPAGRLSDGVIQQKTKYIVILGISTRESTKIKRIF